MILVYHKVCRESPTMWWVDTDSFYRQMLELRCRKIVRLDDYDPDDPSHVVVTFDGVYRNVLRFAAPLLREMSYPFELFVSGDHIGKTNSFDRSEPRAEFATVEDLLELVNCGGRIQWHTRSHRNLGGVTDRDAIARELHVPEDVRRLDAAGFRWLAYPNGDFNPTVVAEARALFTGAVSCNQGNDDDPYMLNRTIVTNETSFKKAGIAVIVPCYNYGALLAEAMESVLRQTRPVDEVLIADDCSTDGTEEVGVGYRDAYPSLVRYHRNQVNLGIAGNFNKAVSMTTAPYVCFLGADNRFRSDYIQRTAEVLDADDSAGVAYTDYALFGAMAEAEWHRLRKVFEGTRKESFFIIHFPDFDDAARSVLLSKHNFIHGSSLFRRRAFEEVGGYAEREDRPEDYDLFRRIVVKGWGAVRVPLPLLEYRQHSRDQAHIRDASWALNYQRRRLRTEAASREMKRLTAENAHLRIYKDSYEYIMGKRSVRAYRAVKGLTLRLINRLLGRPGRSGPTDVRTTRPGRGLPGREGDD